MNRHNKVMKLDSYFSPRSIAIVGVSENPQKVGYLVTKNCIDQGFDGELYLVNPKFTELLGKKVYPSLTSIQKKVDLVVVAVPVDGIPLLLEEMKALDIHNAVVFAAGFKEVGAEGIEKEKLLEEKARAYNITFLGPNCIGFVNTHTRVNTTFLKGTTPQGNIGFVSQSGALGSLIQDYFINHHNLGFSTFVSLGNKTQIDECDVLEYFEDDPQTKVIALYLEDVRSGERFKQVVSRISRKKPIVILKSGSTKEGSQAAVSHTGSMIGDDGVFSAVFEQCGAIRAEYFGEFMSLLRLFSYGRVPISENVLILSNAGGAAVLLTDELIKYHCSLETISEETKKDIMNSMGSHRVTLHNPIDLLGDASAFHYRSTIAATMKEKNVGSVIILLTPQANTQVEETAKVIADAQVEFITPFYPIFMGEKSVGDSHLFFEEKQIVSFTTYDFLPRALSKIMKYQRFCKNSDTFPDPPLDEKKQLEMAITHAKEKKLLVLNFIQSLSLLQTYGIQVCETKTVKSVAEIDDNFAHSYPVVAKLFSEKITHKTDVKGVFVNLQNRQELQVACTDILQIEDAEGCIIQPQVKGYEFIVGAKRDHTFGPVIAVGLGGVLTELIGDPFLMVYPFTKEYFLQKLAEKKWHKLLEGFRGSAMIDAEKLYKVAYGLGELMQASGEIKEIDINPLIMTDVDFVAVDVRIVI